MATTHLYNQTITEIGYGDRDADSKTVAVFINNATGSTESDRANDAINKAVAQAGTSVQPTLNLMQSRAYGITDEKYVVTLRYGRGGYTPPVVDATSNIQETITYIEDANRLGTAEFTYTSASGTGTNAFTLIYRLANNKPISRIRVQTVLSDHPGTFVDQVQGKINADEVSIGPRVCGTWTLRAEGAVINAVHVANPTTPTATLTKWQVSYEFMYDQSRWTRKQKFYGLYAGTVNNLGMVEQPKYPTAVFSGKLPVHAGTIGNGTINSPWVKA